MVLLFGMPTVVYLQMFQSSNEEYNDRKIIPEFKNTHVFIILKNMGGLHLTSIDKSGTVGYI